ncbi:VanZ family protein [Fictibacillus sp. KIGAM418]|uniref:VanZ family protein n=1 Tax=Fictibacillus marinisediminis TaxID=2878389 RepID=A0A9X2BEH0_9BACL|nr:VanZ family protein [Fictibacillus marinisediminis]MCK6259014.1 VanZ family protein [Fictibacillus marinisediminis]
MRLFIVMVWALFLGLHTFTDNLENLLSHQSINFTWLSSPSYHHFFNVSDITWIHPNFYLIKFGHFIGFGILDLFIFLWLTSHRKSMLLTFSFAVFTEVLQLYFGRDGRMYDVIIDSLGIVMVYQMLKYLSKIEKASIPYE